MPRNGLPPSKQKPGKAITASRINESSMGVSALNRIRGGNGVNVQNFGGMPLITGMPFEALALAQAGASGILARSGSTPNSGAVTLLSLSGGVLVNGSADIAWNISSQAVSANAYIILGKIDGNWWVLVESCT